MNPPVAGDRAIDEAAGKELVRNWDLFRVAGSNEEDCQKKFKLLNTQVRAGARLNDIVGSGCVRHAFVASGMEEASGILAAGAAGRLTGEEASPTASVAFVFPGLGGELIGRFSEIASLCPSFERALGRADLVVSDRLGTGVRRLVESHGRQETEFSQRGRLRRNLRASGTLPTVASHCILYTMECALAQMWIDWGARPRYVVGYSLGEISAASVAGLFSFEAGLNLIIERALLLEELPRSGMITVSAGSSAIASAIPTDVYVVGENSATQTVLGGAIPALEHAASSLRALGHIVQELPVEHAFHTPLMGSVASGLAALFSKIATSRPQVSLVSTLTGELIDADSLRKPAHWARHLCEPVQFRRALQALERLDTEVYLEVGPGQALAPLIEDQLQSARKITVLTTMPSEYDARPVAGHVLRTAGRLWTAGVPIEHVPTIRTQEPAPPYAGHMSTPNAANEAVIRTLREIWAVALGCRSVGADDNFFELGGSSLKAARIAMLIRKTFSLELSLREIYSSPTPRQLARVFSTGQHLFGDDDTLTTLPNGLIIRYQSRAEAEYFYRTIFVDKCYLRHGLCLHPGATVVDVGANIGLFSMFAALTSPDIRLYSFEPVPPLFEILRFNLADVCQSATTLNVGVSDGTGQAVITYYPNSPGMSSFVSDRDYEEFVLEAVLRNSSAMGESAASEILQDRSDFMDVRFQASQFQCPLRSLGDIFAEYGIDRVDLLKIDVQKFEMKVLQGIAPNQWAGVRQIAVEVHDQNGRVREVLDLLRSHGFEVAVEQDLQYRGTDVYNIYARR